jgi:hypothetical protein
MKKLIKASKSAKAAKNRVMASFQTDFTGDDLRRKLDELADEMVDEYDGGDIDDYIHRYLNDFIDRECKYYADCIKIIWASDITDWSDADTEITSLAGLAGWILETKFYDDNYNDVYERLTEGDPDEEG